MVVVVEVDRRGRENNKAELPATYLLHSAERGGNLLGSRVTGVGLDVLLCGVFGQVPWEGKMKIRKVENFDQNLIPRS